MFPRHLFPVWFQVKIGQKGTCPKFRRWVWSREEGNGRTEGLLQWWRSSRARWVPAGSHFPLLHFELVSSPKASCPQQQRPIPRPQQQIHGSNCYMDATSSMVSTESFPFHLPQLHTLGFRILRQDLPCAPLLLVSDTSHPPAPSSRPSFPQLLPQLCNTPARARFVDITNFWGVNTPTFQVTDIKSLELGREPTVLPGAGTSQPQGNPKEAPLPCHTQWLCFPGELDLCKELRGRWLSCPIRHPTHEEHSINQSECVEPTNPSVWFGSESAKGMYLLATSKKKKKKKIGPEIEEFSN